MFIWRPVSPLSLLRFNNIQLFDLEKVIVVEVLFPFSLLAKREIVLQSLIVEFYIYTYVSKYLDLLPIALFFNKSIRLKMPNDKQSSCLGGTRSLVSRLHVSK